MKNTITVYNNEFGSAKGSTIATLTDANLQGGVNWIKEINTDSQLEVGDVAAGQITFSFIDTNSIASSLKGKEISWSNTQADNVARTFEGYYITDVEKSKNKVKITALDAIGMVADKVVDDWLEGLTFPMTISAMATSLATFLGITITPYSHNRKNSAGTTITGDTTIINGSYSIPDNFTGTNISARQILVWMAQFTASYAECYGRNTIYFAKYQATGTTLTNANYKSATTAEYQAAVIDKVTVAMNDSDVGVSYGSGTNELKITSNPLFYGDSVAEVQPQVQAVYNKVSSYTAYTPIELELFQDFFIECGDIITVNSKLAMITSKEISSSGISLESVGLETREAATNSLNSEIGSLRGKYNILRQDLDETVSEVGTLEGNVTTLSQTVDEIQIKVETPVEEVTTTTGFTFDADGLTISSSTTDITTNVDEDGMEVSEGSTNLLTADSTGVQAYQLTANSYLNIGTHCHIEDYNNDRVGFFYV